jgi:hypothetical protein
VITTDDEYHLHGIRVRSEWPLPFRTTASGVTLAHIDLVQGSSQRFSTALETARVVTERTKWTDTVLLADGQVYLRWTGRFECLVSSDGSSIAGRSIDRRGGDAFLSHLLARALSFALLRQGFDPLHATVVAIGQSAVAFLGDPGAGKSSLAAWLIRSGDRLLTDDLLVLSRHEADYIAHIGPPCIKLFPEIARQVLGARVRGTPMGKGIPKLVIPLAPNQIAAAAMPLKAMYALAPPSRGRGRTRIGIRSMSKQRACLTLISNPFNAAITDRARLARQLALASDLAAAVPVRHIAYPRAIGALPAVRDALVADLAAL